MTAKIPRTDLPSYFKGLSDRLEQQVKLMTPIIVHSAEMGDNDHHWFAELIRQYLPHRYGIDTGFVVNHESDMGSADFFNTDLRRRTQDPYISNQMDILLTDVMHNAAFCSEKTFKVCPIEMILGAVEVTRDLDKGKLEGDVNKLARIKQLAEKKRYLRPSFTGQPSRRQFEDIYYQRPFTCVVGLSGRIAKKDVEDVIAAHPIGRRPNAIFLLNSALYLFRDESVLSIIEQDCLYHLISIIRLYLDFHRCESADLSCTALRLKDKRSI